MLHIFNHDKIPIKTDFMPLSLSETAVLIARALRDSDVRAMRKINDRCLSETALKFSEHAYVFALVSYVLSKILSKPRYLSESRAKQSFFALQTLLLQCETLAASANYPELLSCQNRILSTIEAMDERDRRFVKGILQKGRLKIASVLYAQGISLGSAAEITGTDKREVLLYAGQTLMFDRLKEKKGMAKRMKELREIFS